MNKQSMIEISKNRENLVAFLHIDDICKINESASKCFNAYRKSFDEICTATLKAHDEKLMTNKQASNVFDILKKENTSFKTESHRYEHGKIFAYNFSDDAYLFLKEGTKHEFNRLNSYL